jgi:hypothetical protein
MWRIHAHSALHVDLLIYRLLANNTLSSRLARREVKSQRQRATWG